MAEPFEERPGIRLSRIPGVRKRAFVIDLENRLAQAERVSEVPAEEIAAIADRHGVNLDEAVLTPRRNLYRRLLDHCLADHAISPDESADLAHLRRILVLGDDQVRAIHDDVARVFYGRAMDQVLVDYRLDPEEETFLQQLRSDLGMTPELASELEAEGAARARQRFLSRAVKHDSVLVASRDTKLELSGQSGESLEAAIRSALDDASRAAPDLRSAELSEVRVELEAGAIARWQVLLKATL